jgi:hypothetical protein
MLGAYALTGWMTDRFGPPATLAMTGAIVGIGGPLLIQVTGALSAVRGKTASRVVFVESSTAGEVI